MSANFAPLIVSGAVFVGSHVLISSTALRGNLQETLGERGYLLLYSLLALVSFAWFALAFSAAPDIEVWSPPSWTHWVPVLTMPLATLLLVAGLLVRNPTAVGQERVVRSDDPAPAILRVTRHPLMWAIGLWSGAHLVANGGARELLFFGPMAVLAIGGTLLIDRRKRLALGTDWQRFAGVTSSIPFAAVLTGRTRLPWHQIGIMPVVAGTLLYAVLFLAHPLLTGWPVLLP